MKSYFILFPSYFRDNSFVLVLEMYLNVWGGKVLFYNFAIQQSQNNLTGMFNGNTWFSNAKLILETEVMNEYIQTTKLNNTNKSKPRINPQLVPP